MRPERVRPLYRASLRSSLWDSHAGQLSRSNEHVRAQCEGKGCAYLYQAALPEAWGKHREQLSSGAGWTVKACRRFRLLVVYDVEPRDRDTNQPVGPAILWERFEKPRPHELPGSGCPYTA